MAHLDAQGISALKRCLEARFFGTNALTTTTSRLGDLLTKFNGRLHVVATTLQFSKCPLPCHLPLEVLDRTLDTFVSNLNLERSALH